MEFYKIIDKYYLDAPKNELIKLLKNISALNIIEYTVNEFYIEIKDKNRLEVSVILSITISDFIIAINTGKKLIKSGYSEKEKELIQLGIYLIKETFISSKLSSIEYFSILKQTIRIIYKKHKWDFDVLNQLLNFDNLQDFSHNTNTQKEIITSKPQYLVWNSKSNIDFFVSDLTKLMNIKPKKGIYKLFDAIDDDFKIEINSEHLEVFLSLFYILNQCDVIISKGNRGIYKYLEKHIIPHENDNFPKIEFRKIRYNVFQKNNKKDEILKKLEPFKNKYCNDGL